MNKKLFASLAPLLAVTAFAVVPAAAQAEPHWYKGTTLIGSSPITIATSGNLTLNTLGASIKCKVTDAEEIWNPVGGGAGQDSVTAFMLTGCKNKVASASCPKGPITITAEGLPWPSRLFSTPPPASVIRDEITKIRLNVGCAGSAGTVGDVFEGSLTPEVGNGTLIFGPGSGSLLDSGSNPLTISGVDKLKGPPKGKITAKDP